MDPHPATLDQATLLAACRMRRQRRSGPGGQHRNKVETAVVLEHLPSGIRASASERRSQQANRQMAVHRLRVRLAVELRSELTASTGQPPSQLWQARCLQQRITVNPLHADFPALLAEALDQVAAAEYDMAQAADRLQTTVSQLTKLLKLAPEAFERVNTARQARGLRVLR